MPARPYGRSSGIRIHAYSSQAEQAQVCPFARDLREEQRMRVGDCRDEVHVGRSRGNPLVAVADCNRYR